MSELNYISGHKNIRVTGRPMVEEFGGETTCFSGKPE